MEEDEEIEIDFGGDTDVTELPLRPPGDVAVIVDGPRRDETLIRGSRDSRVGVVVGSLPMVDDHEYEPHDVTHLDGYCVHCTRHRVEHAFVGAPLALPVDEEERTP